MADGGIVACGVDDRAPGEGSSCRAFREASVDIGDQTVSGRDQSAADCARGESATIQIQHAGTFCVILEDSTGDDLAAIQIDAHIR